MASKIAAVVARFPERELEIHRLYSQYGAFREMCEDYEELLSVLRRWEAPGHAEPAKAEDYRRIRDELEAEILGILDRPRGCSPHRDES